jgi:hypothetical protein
MELNFFELMWLHLPDSEWSWSQSGDLFRKTAAPSTVPFTLTTSLKTTAVAEDEINGSAAV